MKEFKGYKRGVNLGGWLSQCNYSDETLNGFITEADIERIASWGLDHVRIPMDYNIFMDDSGSFIERGFEAVDRALAWCEKHGLNAVLDLHKTMGFSFDSGHNESGFFESEELQELFYRLWEELARRYGGLYVRVSFELLNEVTDKAFIGKWNEISNECIRRIRAIAPDVVILVGSYWNNSVSAVQDLDAPYDDKIVYNFHCYEPMVFTHQGATWTDMIDPTKRVVFEQSLCCKAYFEEMFRSAIEAAEKNDTVLYCGEYGVINVATPEDTLKWYKTINAVLEKHGIGRSAWSYKKMDFGLTDERLAGVIDELVKYL